MKAEYIDHMGDDLRVVNAARVSFDKESDWDVELLTGFENDATIYNKVLEEKDEKLISYLAKHNHWTPFSHPQITMRETVPIFIARQRFKHMVGFTYNEVSRRYVDDEPTFYTPDVWRSRPEGSVKQGSGEDEIVWVENDYWEGYIDEDYKNLLEKVRAFYNAMIDSGVAPEQARMILPQSMYTSYYVTGSLAAWARAYKQRIDSHAQKEIQDLAKQWDDIIRPLFPVSWDALVS